METIKLHHQTGVYYQIPAELFYFSWKLFSEMELFSEIESQLQAQHFLKKTMKMAT